MDISQLQWSFALYALIVFASLWTVAKKYGTIVNPLSYYTGVFALQTLVMPALFVWLSLIDLHQYSPADLSAMVRLSALHIACIAFAYRCPWSPLQRPMDAITPTRPVNITGPTQIVMGVQAIVVFAILALAGSGGTLWFSNPRLAYQTCRDGVGVFWSLSHASLILAFCCTMTMKRRSTGAVIGIAICFGACAYFLGSKTFTLYYLVLGIFYVQHHVCRISKGKLIGVGVAMLVGVSCLQMMQGTAATIMDTVEYFDYATNTTMFLSDFDKMFGHTYGETLASESWLFVPRALYPDKPYAYGAASIMETYYPGAAEKGNTAGILTWSGAYWDFGAVGVIIQGLFLGFLSKAAFEHFRRHGSIWSILMLGQIGFMAITAQTMENAPIPLFALWMFLEWGLLRLVGGTPRSHIRASVRLGGTPVTGNSLPSIA